MVIDRLIYLLLFAIIFGCRVASVETTKEDSESPKTIPELEIFVRDKELIKDDIHEMFSEYPETFKSFDDHTIVLNLTCDTPSCSITKIDIEDDDGFSNFSEILIHYFSKMSPIICYHRFYRVNVSMFDILVSEHNGEIIFKVYTGYRME